MPDPRNHVLPGQRLRLAAQQVNGLNRLLRTDAGFSGTGLEAGPHAPYTWVYGRTTSAVSRWAVVAITGVAVTPTSSDTAAATKQFHSMPIVTLGTPSSSSTAFGVAIEPINQGKIGKIAVAGAVQVKKADLDKLTSKTVLWADANWALIVLGTGGVRFGEVSAGWNKGAVATVTRLYPDGDPYDPSQAFSALNQFATVPAPAAGETRFVMCVLVETTWMLIAAECE
jgi:hypothetical protein